MWQWHNQSCQQPGWQNKALRSHWVNSQQSNTQIGFEATLKPTRFVLSDSEDNRHTNQHTTGHCRDTSRYQGSNLTSNKDSNRSQVGYARQWHLGVQQPMRDYAKDNDKQHVQFQWRDGTTEDFEEQLHSLLPTQARRTLDGQPWTGETWFKVKPDFNPPRPTIARPTPTRTDPHGPNEIQPSTVRATRHTHEESIDKTTTTIMLTQSADTSTGEYHIPRILQQQQEIIGSKKDMYRRGSINKWEQIFTYPSKRTMDQMSHNYAQREWHLSNQQMATGHANLMMTG